MPIMPIAIKLTLGIITLVIQINLTGKGNLAPTSVLDQIQNYVLGGIIGGVIYNPQITILQYLIVLLIWTLLTVTLKYLKEHIPLIKQFVDGKPVILISNGEINVSACLKLGLSANDLMFKLRSAGYSDTKSIKRAVQEQNGQLTIIQYGEASVKFPLITNGVIVEETLLLIDQPESWLLAELAKQSIALSDVYLGEYVHGKLQLTLYPKPAG